MPTQTTASLLPVAINQTALALAQTMFGEGITVVSASYQGDGRSAGIYTNGDTISPGAVPSASGVILSTGLATDFTNDSGNANQSSSTTTDTTGVNGDALMNGVAGMATYDAAIFNASFTSTGDELSMRLVFGSEEYLEWVNSGFNDAVGIWVNGQRVMLSLGDGSISIDTINTTNNANLYHDNTSGSLNSEMDGLTRVLTLKAPLLAGQTNTIRIAIADAGDAAYDSALLIVADSVQSALLAKDDAFSVTGFGHTNVNLLNNDMTVGRGAVHISAINDIAVAPGGVVNLNAGDAVRLEANGTVTFLSAGLNGAVTFSYTMTDASGTADTAFVTIDPQAVDGTAGDDSMLVKFRDTQGNTIDGNDGDAEAIFGYAGHDKIFAGLGNDHLDGGVGNDFMRSGLGNDKLVGADGADVLDGELGVDTMEGGAGNDVYYIDNIGDSIIEAAASGYDKVIAKLSHVLGDTLEELWLRAGTLATDGTGNALANKMVGNELANHLSGLGGNDTIIAGAGNDSVTGGTGADLLFGKIGDDLLDGGDGADKLLGGDGQDILIGGAGNDTLVAAAGGDDLTGGAGNDILGAGTGADQFHFSTGAGVDRIVGFDATADHLVFHGLVASDLDISQIGTRTIISWGTADKVVISNWLPDLAVDPLPFDFI